MHSCFMAVGPTSIFSIEVVFTPCRWFCAEISGTTCSLGYLWYLHYTPLVKLKPFLYVEVSLDVTFGCYISNARVKYRDFEST